MSTKFGPNITGEEKVKCPDCHGRGQHDVYEQVLIGYETVEDGGQLGIGEGISYWTTTQEVYESHYIGNALCGRCQGVGFIPVSYLTKTEFDKHREYTEKVRQNEELAKQGLRNKSDEEQIASKLLTLKNHPDMPYEVHEAWEEKIRRFPWSSDLGLVQASIVEYQAGNAKYNAASVSYGKVQELYQASLTEAINAFRESNIKPKDSPIPEIFAQLSIICIISAIILYLVAPKETFVNLSLYCLAPLALTLFFLAYYGVKAHERATKLYESKLSDVEKMVKTEFADRLEAAQKELNEAWRAKSNWLTILDK